MAYLLVIIKLIIAILVLVIDQIKRKQKKKWGRKIVYLIILALFLDALFSAYIGYSSDRMTSKAYLLAKCNSNTGRLDSLTKSKFESPRLLTGNGSNGYFEWEGGEGKPIIKLSDEKIYLEMKNKKAVISLDLRNKDGKLIGYITNNEWHISRNEVLDINYTQDTLEIIDNQNEIFLQIRIAGESVWLAGTFYGKYPSRDRLELRPWLRSGVGWDARIFKYPSCEHYGEKKS